MRQPIGLLLAQLGTPAAPTAAALRPYLRQFLSDPRVIEVSRPIWKLILELFILPFRPRASARKYARIWSADTGSPLLHHCVNLTARIAEELGDGFAVALGMRYGQPSIAAAIDQMCEQGCDRIVVLALYPQYSAAATASAWDAVLAAASARRHVPALHLVPPHPLDDGYLDAVATRTEETLTALSQRPDHTLITFHGLPVAMIEKGDPYRDQCMATADALADRLGLAPDEWTLTFQSRFGRAAWLEPYVDARLRELAAAGRRRVLVVTPGFTADCLETLDELGREAAETFRAAGGSELTLVPCVNDHPRWVEAMTDLARREAAPWTR